jgi:hypothetical protein
MEKYESNIKKNFRIPDDYFNQMEREVLAKTVGQKKHRTISFQHVRPWMKIAASILMISIVGFGVVQFNSSTTIDTQQLANEDIMTNMDEELFTAMLFEEEAPVADETLTDLADFLIELEEFDF